MIFFFCWNIWKVNDMINILSLLIFYDFILFSKYYKLKYKKITNQRWPKFSIPQNPFAFHLIISSYKILFWIGYMDLTESNNSMQAYSIESAKYYNR